MNKKEFNDFFIKEKNKFDKVYLASLLATSIISIGGMLEFKVKEITEMIKNIINNEKYLDSSLAMLNTMGIVTITRKDKSLFVKVSDEKREFINAFFNEIGNGNYLFLDSTLFNEEERTNIIKYFRNFKKSDRFSYQT